MALAAATALGSVGVTALAVAQPAAPAAGEGSMPYAVEDFAGYLADPAPVPLEATFNDPAKTAPRPQGVSPSAWGNQNAVRDQLIDLIRRAEKGSLVRGSVYLFTDDEVRKALLARKADLRIQLLLDGDAVASQVWRPGPDGAPEAVATGSEYKALSDALGKAEYGQSIDADTAGSFVLACPEDRGCVGNRVLAPAGGTGEGESAINHNKFFLFEKVGATSNVVFQASANLTSNHRVGMYNNAVTIPDAGLYQEYSRYWTQLLDHGTHGAGMPDNYTTKDVGTYKTYFFPRIESDKDIAPGSPVDPRNDAGTDTVVSLLQNVDCKAVPATQVRIGMYAFTRTQVADTLREMQAAGCEVQVVHNGDPGNVGSAVKSALATSGLKTLRVCEGTEAGAGALGIHSKYLLIDGTYLGTGGRKLVFTGSHNYTYPNLRSQDETLLKIENTGIYEKFRQNFDKTLLEGGHCNRTYATAP
ncbi:phospholipase D-like domain-containing protein [Streptomyces sp. NPDC060028]|uniref:phospholipase D-like domain-containing protein n=1 Tax=Streptomyces sp. NPDC060028 TaxID=3347041 RepID=UPI0036884203